MNRLMSKFPLHWPWRWIALGVLGYALFLIATIPAAKLVTRLQTYNVQTAGVSGSIWNGRAAAVQVRGFNLGATEWRLSFFRLLLGKLSLNLQSKRDDGFINAKLSVGFGGAIALHDL